MEEHRFRASRTDSYLGGGWVPFPCSPPSEGGDSRAQPGMGRKPCGKRGKGD